MMSTMVPAFLVVAITLVTTFTSSFTVLVPSRTQLPSCSFPSSSTALFDSRKKQKIASRTAWLEKRNPGSTDASAATEEVTDVVDDNSEEDSDVTTEAAGDVAATEDTPEPEAEAIAAVPEPEPVAATPEPEAIVADVAATEPESATPPVAAATAGLFKNDQGLDYVQLVHPDTGAKSQIYVYGGVVTSYQDKDGTEFIAVRPDAMMDGSKPISGGLSHCWPQFGPGVIQQHGFARNVEWTIGDRSDTSVTMTLQPNDYTKAIWDQPFTCSFTVTLQADQLDTKMMVENTGTEPWSFQAALHSYFTVSALDSLEISGSWKGKEFLNKLVGDNGETQTEERDVITITEEYDRVYTGVNDPILMDKGTQKSLSVLNTAGWEDTVLWNPYGNEKMGYNNFVCVESVKFNPVELAGGANWVGDMSLKPASL